MSFFENTRKPAGFSGRVMVSMMNLCHSPMARWGFRFLKLAGNAAVLDCGCGGGANLTRLLKNAPTASSRASTTPPSAWKKPGRSTSRPFSRAAAPCCKEAWRT